MTLGIQRLVEALFMFHKKTHFNFKKISYMFWLQLILCRFSFFSSLIQTHWQCKFYEFFVKFKQLRKTTSDTNLVSNGINHDLLNTEHDLLGFDQTNIQSLLHKKIVSYLESKMHLVLIIFNIFMLINCHLQVTTLPRYVRFCQWKIENLFCFLYVRGHR